MTDQIYTQGQKFRVVREGGHLTGMKPIGPYAQQGWSRAMRVGEVLTCAGISMTFGDGVPVVKWHDADDQWIANDCEFRPSIGGMWSSRPDPSYLEPLED